MNIKDLKFDLLIKAVIQQESAGKSDAVSPAGARGAMQLMDATGQEWHKKLNIQEPYDPFNYHQNVKIGTAYLEWLCKVFGGNIELALAAYNGGVGRVSQAVINAKSTNWAEVKPFLKDKKGEPLYETLRYPTQVLVKYQMLESAEV